MEHFLETWGEALILFSIVSFVLTLLIVPAIIIRLPADYFSTRHRHALPVQHPLLKYPLLFFKNLLGAVFVVMGIIMLFTPGQGLITLLTGMMIMNYPGKYRFERWLIVRFGLLKPINWYRARHHKAPLEKPASPYEKGE